MISRHGNALIPRHKFFPHTTKNRLPDPSETCALESQGEFRRFGICSVSATIDNDRSIFAISNENCQIGLQTKEDRQLLPLTARLPSAN
jgi:hypothetical protein